MGLGRVDGAGAAGGAMQAPRQDILRRIDAAMVVYSYRESAL